MQTILLDTATIDLVLDVNGNIAVASSPYALAQDAASACRTFKGECYYDTTLGVPLLTNVFGKSPPLPLLKAYFSAAAATVPDTVNAQALITSLKGRVLTGQTQVTDAATGQTAVAAFTTVNPQGVG